MRLVVVCSCATRSSPADLFSCIDSNCEMDQKFCANQKACYSTTEYDIKCVEKCPPKFKFCVSTGACLSEDSECPSCAEPGSPHYCQLNHRCVDSPKNCALDPPIDEPDDTPQKGMSALGALAISLLVAAV